MTDYIEQDCTFEHDGHTHESGGALVTDTHCVVYLGPCQNSLHSEQHRDVVGCVGEAQSWHGTRLGRYQITHQWPTPRSHVSGHLYQVEVRIGAMVSLSVRTYTGRSAGVDTIFKGKRKASDQRKPTAPKLLTLIY